MLKPMEITQKYLSRIAALSGQSVVENKFPQSSEIVEILAVYPQVSLIACEVSSGRVNYSGRLILSIVYLDDSGKLCRMQKGAEFSHYIDNDILAPAQSGICNLVCQRTQIKRDGSAFVISSIVEADIEIFSQKERVYITQCDGAEVKVDNIKLYSAVTFSGESEVEDDFDVDSVADILIPGAHVIILSAQCRTAEVEIEGEIYLSLLAMRDNAPTCMDRVIPFKATIPCEQSSIGKTADVKVDINELNVTANVNEERGRCAVELVCNLSFNGVFYDDEIAPAVTDAFATDRQLQLSFADEEIASCTDIKVYSERVSGLAGTKSKLDYSCSLRAVALPDAQFNYGQQSGVVEGSVSAILIYEQGGETKSTEINLPFAVHLNGVTQSDQLVKVDVAVSGVTVKQRTEGEMEAEAILKVTANMFTVAKYSYVTAIEEGDALPANQSAISVYFPQKGDGLWQLAKKLRSSKEEILSCNQGLSFPLNGDERIIIYRQKQNK